LPPEPLSYRQCYPGDIAARPSEAADEVISKGVGHCRKDDRDRDPRIFRRQSTGRPADVPVIFPPGRARLATNPNSTASLTPAMTMGIVVVAFLTARTVGFPPEVTMTSTLSRTISVASSGRRSKFS